MRYQLILVFLGLFLLLSGCGRFTNECGEYGECTYNIADAIIYSESIQNIDEILAVECFQSISTLGRNGISEYNLVADDNGICLILIDDIENETKLYTYGSSENTGEMNVDVIHTPDDYLSFLGLETLPDNYYLSWDTDVSIDVFVNIDGKYYSLFSNEMLECEFVGDSCSVLSE